MLYTSTEFFSSTVAGSGGHYVLTVPSGEVVYLPFKESYRGHYVTENSSVSGVDLLLEQGTELPVSSGKVFTHLYNAPLVTSTTVLDIVSTVCHMFAITDSGLDIVDIYTHKNSGYVVYSGGFTSIYIDSAECDFVNVYLGTSSSGVMRVVYSGTGGDLSDNLEFALSGSILPSTSVTSLDGDGDALVVGTSSGICMVSGNDAYSHEFSAEVSTCRITASGDIYYSPTGSGVYVKYGPINSNWTEVDYTMTTSTTPSIVSDTVNILDYNVSNSGVYTVFLGTTSGICIYTEDRLTPSGSTVKILQEELDSTSYNVVSVLKYEDTLKDSGNLIFTVLSTGDEGKVSILDLSTDSIVSNLDIANFETNLGRPGITRISGSRFLDK